MESLTGLNVKHDAGVEVVSCNGDEIMPPAPDDGSAVPGVLLLLIPAWELLATGTGAAAVAASGAGGTAGEEEQELDKEEAGDVDADEVT